MAWILRRCRWISYKSKRLMIKIPLAERFMSLVDRDTNDPYGCWVWVGSRLRGKYGRFRIQGKTKFAHRVSYELFVGQIPAELELDHVCNTHACVNPAHLQPVTRAENMRRRPFVGVALANAKKTHCQRGHLLAGDNLRGGQRAGNRSCKQCCTDLARERRLLCV